MYLLDDMTRSELARLITRHIPGDRANDTASLNRACGGGAGPLVSGGGGTSPRSGELELSYLRSLHIIAAPVKISCVAGYLSLSLSSMGNSMTWTNCD
jgi:hypothetical protein